MTPSTSMCPTFRSSSQNTWSCRDEQYAVKHQRDEKRSQIITECGKSGNILPFVSLICEFIRPDTILKMQLSTSPGHDASVILVKKTMKLYFLIEK